MNESYRLKMIEDLHELIEIPEVDTYIFLTIEQAKIKFAEEIRNYYHVKNTFQRTKRGNLMLIEDKNPSQQTQSYYFEFKRIKPKDSMLKFQWLIATIKPTPKEDPWQIIPVEFMNMMDFHAVDPDKIETFKNFKSRSLKKYFDIRFTRYSDTHVMGSIRENCKEVADNTDENEQEQEAFKLNLSKKNTKRDYMELFRYMEEYPEIREDIFNRFDMVQKPYVDNTKKSKSR